jgi:hypothetical protein
MYYNRYDTDTFSTTYSHYQNDYYEQPSYVDPEILEQRENETYNRSNWNTETAEQVKREKNKPGHACRGPTKFVLFFGQRNIIKGI